MQVIVSVAVSFLVKIAVVANVIAASAAVTMPDDRGAAPGCTTSRTPAKPSTPASTLTRVSRSPRKIAASTIVQSGEVNSSAKTSASGLTVMA
jgi:hypothetical protein